MPKDNSNPHLSSTRSRDCPYSRPSEDTDQCSSKSILEFVGDEGEWENTICPVCVEHPHKAVLLICSSHIKGCRPYMCDTSPRHSNCFDQFRERAPRQTVDVGEDFIRSSSIKKLENKVQCPLCRGQISGWVVVEAARNCMNSKSRTCSLESCEFSGTYKELKKHARREHPSNRPTDVDPRRQEEWMRRENERVVEEILGVPELDNPIEDITDSQVVPDDWTWEETWEDALRNLTDNEIDDIIDDIRDFLQQGDQPETRVNLGDMSDLNIGLPFDSELPLDMPYIISSHFHFGGQDVSITSVPDTSLGDPSSGESNLNEDQPQPESNSNEDQPQPESNSNEDGTASARDQLQPDGRQL